MDTKQIIEVGGVKLEVDMRYARRVEELRVGSRVKVLAKNYSGHSVYPGVVVGFEPFPTLPTIIVAYIESDYSKCELKFFSFNSQSAEKHEMQIVAALDEVPDLDKEQVFAWFDREIEKHRRGIDDLELKRRYFATNFRQYWEQIVPQPETAS